MVWLSQNIGTIIVCLLLIGIISAITRIADKFNRVKNLAKLPPDRQRVKSESIADTLLDMANYCIMTVIEIENQNKQGGANNE